MLGMEFHNREIQNYNRISVELGESIFFSGESSLHCIKRFDTTILLCIVDTCK